MNKMTRRSTIRFDAEVYQALRVKSSLTNRSVSLPVNNAVRQLLAEDLDDLAAFQLRANESVLDFDEPLQELNSHGLQQV